MRAVLYIVLFAYALLPLCAGNITVVDKTDSSPLVGATVFSRSGSILGMTDANGVMAEAARGDYPLMVRCLGYKTYECGLETDSVYMEPEEYLLAGVTVGPGSCPITRVLCYAREYCSGATVTDTVQMFNEYMADAYLCETKVKDYDDDYATPRVLGVWRYVRYADSQGLDSVASPSDDDGLSWLSMSGFNSGEVKEPETIRGGAKTDTVMGKHSVYKIFRKSDDMFTANYDLLANNKNHKSSPFLLKLLGFTMDIDELRCSEGYAANSNGVYTPADMLYKTYSIHIVGRGKWIKKLFKTKTPVDMYSYIELYPVEVSYITVEEMKELREKSLPEVEVNRGRIAPPLSPATQSLVNRAKALEKP